MGREQRYSLVYEHSVSVSWWGLLKSPRKNAKFSKILRSETREKFFLQGGMETDRDGMKIQGAKLRNTSRPKNMEEAE